MIPITDESTNVLLDGLAPLVPIVAPIRLMGTSIGHPGQTVLRLIQSARLALAGSAADRERLVAWVSTVFGADAGPLHAEYLGSDFRRWYLARRAELGAAAGPQRAGTSGDLNLEALYLVVRAARPRVVVQTGVRYGASSGHILSALARNGVGHLHSIGLPLETGMPPHDILVPDELRGRWTLYPGDSRHELPGLLERLSSVNLFYDDGMHTSDHVTWELQTVLPYLSPGGTLASHDARVANGMRKPFRRKAFAAFCSRHRLFCRTFHDSGFAIRDPRSADRNGKG
jgi:hypothetical protein